MAARQIVIAAQTAWAKARGLNPDARGYLASYDANLRRPLSPSAIACFRTGSGNELVAKGDRPAKMSALHSSSALVVNVFDEWIEQPDTILAALGLPTGGVSLKFEAQFPTGLDGTPPNLDAAIKWADGHWLGIESKFTEWLTPKSSTKEPFRTAYFPEGSELWSTRGCMRCQELAFRISTGEVKYRYLDAPQLLKHALGLACSGSRFELLYLYFDVPGRESELHRAEIADFLSRVSGDFPFHVRRYQDLFERLESNSGDGRNEHLNYLRDRYFPNAATT